MKPHQILYRVAYILTVILLMIFATSAQAQERQPVPERVQTLEAVILIEDMIEWTEWDIQEGKTAQETGHLFIQNLERLKAMLTEERAKTIKA